MTQVKRRSPAESFSPSLEDFCRLVEYYSRRTDDPRVLAALCERQAEVLRIEAQDVTLESVDLLLNTMLDSLQHLAEAQDRKRWPNRVKALLHSASPQETLYVST